MGSLRKYNFLVIRFFCRASVLTTAIVTSIFATVGAASAQVPVTPTPPAPAAPLTDYPDALWVPAAPGNFRAGERPAPEQPIDMIVIHDIEGTAESAVHWFQNPQARVSSHYVVEGVTGRVYQQVREKDVAYHAGNGRVNARSVGIEHEGFAYRPGYYNRVEYEASARLVRSISDRYRIPRDRQHIIGHFEVPNPNDPTKAGGSGGHTDPGPWWDWDYFMTLVRSEARVESPPLFPTVLHPGEAIEVPVALTNTGDDPWPAAARGNETAEAIAQRAKGLVYLGTWDNSGQPFGPASAFYGKGWAGPRFVAPVAGGDTLPGTAAAFTFSLHGPTIAAAGTVTEQFRLWRVPSAPHPPVPFGPILSATVRVEPWEIIVDASPSAAFSAPGWQTKGGSYGKPIYWTKTHLSAKSSVSPVTASAEWQTTLPVAGRWEVFVRTTPGASHTTRATYSGLFSPADLPPGTVQDGTLFWGALVDQRTGSTNSGDWKSLGRHTFSAKDPTVIRLRPDAAPGEVVVADSVRFVGPFPADPTPAANPTKAVSGSGPRP